MEKIRLGFNIIVKCLKLFLFGKILNDNRNYKRNFKLIFNNVFVYENCLVTFVVSLKKIISAFLASESMEKLFEFNTFLARKSILA